MNLEEVYNHPVADVYNELKQYSEEPGDPVWEKSRHRISILAKINQPIMEHSIWKAMIFDTLKSAYNKIKDEDSVTDLKLQKALSTLLIGAFKHVDEIEKSNEKN